MDDIYREVLMEHFKNPQNRGQIANPTGETIKKNPLCGDVIKMDFVVEDGKVKDIKFDGSACAVSIASSSVLTEAVEGMTLDEIKKLTKDDLLDMLGVELTTSRVKCASLPLEALQNLIKDYEESKLDKKE